MDPNKPVISDSERIANRLATAQDNPPLEAKDQDMLGHDVDRGTKPGVPRTTSNFGEHPWFT